ncbi:long-chain acyl-CoA synthetase [Entomortierella parvispora]|uniref:Long-chain acyl-CoA synthetase n=1 Tax=Entomortierella parvispora TaxID=205924 RepID=A0A9P3HFR0_9FUNG|nr:long-chain acyl-CoA synthetase [Entomortierella parvispora]
MTKCLTVEVGPTDVQGETRIRRSVLSAKRLMSSPEDDVKTLFDVFNHSVKVRPKLNAIGYRKVVKVVEEEKEVTKIVGGEEVKETKTWKFVKLSGYHWLTYEAAKRVVDSIGCGLRKFGVQPKDKMTVFGSTSANWLLVAHGAFTQSITIVTAYDTLGEDGLLHSMNEAEVATAYTNADLLNTIKNVAGKCPTLKKIIYDGEAKPADVIALKEAHPHLELITLEELKQLGEDNPVEPTPPAAKDYCCIMYTSGSTGNPKGVLLTHGNLVAAIGGVNKMLTKYVHEGDVLLAYLPLAHVLEFLVENVCLFWGVTLGYGTVRTLTDSSVRECQGDIKELRPTLMTGVPAVWETIRKGVLAQVSQGSPLVQKIFHAALNAKAWCLDNNLSALTGVFDAVVFNKVKQQTGGRLRFALSGGAPISQETQRFLSTALCPILQGYGMTESCGMCAILTPDVFNYGRVGSPVPCTEVKLVDVPDAGYFSTDSPRPRGEVCIRGPSITAGYFKNPEETSATLTADRWLKTGDIGEWHPDGTISIIDRKKNLVKLSHGEYIALEKLESVYKSTAYCNNICVYADSMQSKPVALIVASEPRILELAKAKGLESRDFAALCKDRVIIKGVLDACLATAKRAGLKPAEMLQGVYLESEEWTAQAGLLTAAQKLKRKEINQAYVAEIKTLYS